jgi:hypothetical protein
MKAPAKVEVLTRNRSRSVAVPPLSMMWLMTALL